MISSVPENRCDFFLAFLTSARISTVSLLTLYTVEKRAFTARRTKPATRLRAGSAHASDVPGTHSTGVHGPHDAKRLPLLMVLLNRVRHHPLELCPSRVLRSCAARRGPFELLRSGRRAAPRWCSRPVDSRWRSRLRTLRCPGRRGRYAAAARARATDPTAKDHRASGVLHVCGSSEMRPLVCRSMKAVDLPKAVSGACRWPFAVKVGITKCVFQLKHAVYG